ncbi:hypothetical protein ENSA5_35640 [Enhygromyxa salina]|uniref:Translocation protein TolB n=1 Tax=Enhygromyxa salina TaxID=215803 RepID=A0A2S9XVL7_9BACT|nr:hypothetical protein ENSA5_35640 [Enhygromyxa salina]
MLGSGFGCGPDEVPLEPSDAEIAFVRVHHDDGAEQLCAFTPGEPAIALLARERSGTSIADLGWSADGRLLAFTRQRDDKPSIIHSLDPELGVEQMYAIGQPGHLAGLTAYEHGPTSAWGE